MELCVNDRVIIKGLKGKEKKLDGKIGTIIKIVIPNFAYFVKLDNCPEFFNATGTFEPKYLEKIQ